MGGRLDVAFVERVEAFCDRVLHVAKALDDAGCHSRIVGQLIGCGTSVGANVFEADEALSRADFAKTIGITIKELNEVRFWLRLVGRHDWVATERLDGLLAEAAELKLILGSILTRTRQAT